MWAFSSSPHSTIRWVYKGAQDCLLTLLFVCCLWRQLERSTGHEVGGSGSPLILLLSSFSGLKKMKMRPDEHTHSLTHIRPLLECTFPIFIYKDRFFVAWCKMMMMMMHLLLAALSLFIVPTRNPKYPTIDSTHSLSSFSLHSFHFPSVSFMCLHTSSFSFALFCNLHVLVMYCFHYKKWEAFCLGPKVIATASNEPVN